MIRLVFLLLAVAIFGVSCESKETSGKIPSESKEPTDKFFLSLLLHAVVAGAYGSSGPCQNYRCPYRMECKVRELQCPSPPCQEVPYCKKRGDCPAAPSTCYLGRHQCQDDMRCPGPLKCCYDGCIYRCAYAQNVGRIGK